MMFMLQEIKSAFFTLESHRDAKPVVESSSNFIASIKGK
jgi:hypothetical protein